VRLFACWVPLEPGRICMSAPGMGQMVPRSQQCPSHASSAHAALAARPRCECRHKGHPRAQCSRRDYPSHLLALLAKRTVSRKGRNSARVGKEVTGATATRRENDTPHDAQGNRAKSDVVCGLSRWLCCVVEVKEMVSSVLHGGGCHGWCACMCVAMCSLVGRHPACRVASCMQHRRPGGRRQLDGSTANRRNPGGTPRARMAARLETEGMARVPE